MPDIDIDFADREKALQLFNHTVAVRYDNGSLKNHNTGAYFTSIPRDARTNTSTIDYKQAEERGYFKIDFLNVGIYEGVRDEEHLKQLMATDPIWDLLLEDEFTNNLFHVNGYGAILRETKPRCIMELAAVLAMIRPAKRYLIGKDWATIMSEVWIKPESDEYYFKKAHAVAYAQAVVVQMNLLCEQMVNASA